MSDLMTHDLRAYNQSVAMPFHAVVRDLVAFLDLRLIANIAGVVETRAVREWAEGVREARGSINARLRFALRLVSLLVASSRSPEVARAWLECPSPQLGNRIPIHVLRDEELEEVAPKLMEAAYALPTLSQDHPDSSLALTGASSL